MPRPPVGSASLSDKKSLGRDFDAQTLQVQDERERAPMHPCPAPQVIGTDGSASAIRRDLLQRTGATCPRRGAGLRLQRADDTRACPAVASSRSRKMPCIFGRAAPFMLIASAELRRHLHLYFIFATCGQAKLRRPAKSPRRCRLSFEHWFADAVPLLHDLQAEFAHNPVGRMVTVKCAPWSLGGHTLLLGDAAHAIVPFFGQGANCGFEDCTVFNAGLDAMEKAGESDWEALFETLRQAAQAAHRCHR